MVGVTILRSNGSSFFISNLIVSNVMSRAAADLLAAGSAGAAATASAFSTIDVCTAGGESAFPVEAAGFDMVVGDAAGDARSEQPLDTRRAADEQRREPTSTPSQRRNATRLYNRILAFCLLPSALIFHSSQHRLVEVIKHGAPGIDGLRRLGHPKHPRHLKQLTGEGKSLRIGQLGPEFDRSASDCRRNSRCLDRGPAEIA